MRILDKIYIKQFGGTFSVWRMAFNTIFVGSDTFELFAE